MRIHWKNRDGQRYLSRAYHPPKCIAGGSSDTHNNHNNGISRVTRGPPPRIGTAYGTAHITPSAETTHQAGESSRRVVFPRLYAGATTQPDCGPSGLGPSFRVELQPRNVHGHAAKREQHEEKWIVRLLRDRLDRAKSGSSLTVPIVERGRILFGIEKLELIGEEAKQDQTIDVSFAKIARRISVKKLVLCGLESD